MVEWRATIAERWSLLFIWSVSFVWLNQIDQMNQINPRSSRFSRKSRPSRLSHGTAGFSNLERNLSSCCQLRPNSCSCAAVSASR